MQSKLQRGDEERERNESGTKANKDSFEGCKQKNVQSEFGRWTNKNNSTPTNQINKRKKAKKNI